MIAQIYAWLAFATGTVALFALLLWALAWVVVQICKWLKVWHVLCLAVSIRLHGKDFADNQFWWAIQERASRSKFAAKNIANFALEQAPKETP